MGYKIIFSSGPRKGKKIHPGSRSPTFKSKAEAFRYRERMAKTFGRKVTGTKIVKSKTRSTKRSGGMAGLF